MSPLDSAWKPGFSLATLRAQRIRDFVTVALCKFTFTITITADYYTAQFVTYSDKIRKKCAFLWFYKIR